MKKIVLAFILLSFLACGDDDSPSSPSGFVDTISESLELLTDGSSKTWVISNAVLNNGGRSVSLDITNSLNVIDDRFIFSMDGEGANVVWKQREAINWQANSVEEIFRDFYASNETFELIIAEDNASIFTAFDGRQDFTIVDDSTITGIIEPESGVEFIVTLRPFTEEDLTDIPTSLEFIEIRSVILDGSGGITIGCTSSALTNTIYFSQREEIIFDDCLPGMTAHIENIVSFNINTGIYEEHSFCQPSGFVTKELEIIDGNLVSLSSSTMNTYNLNLNQDPNIVTINPYDDFIAFSRQGTATLGNDIYVIGGDASTFFDLDPSNDDDENKSKVIYKFNDITNSFEFVSEMPSSKFFADGEIVDDKLYVFGGNSEFLDNIFDREDHIYIYDFTTDSWSTEFLPEPILDTFTARYQDLIYVAGYSFFDNDDDDIADFYRNYLGVYDTEDGTFTEIPYTLDTSTPFSRFTQTTILGNKMYLLTRSDVADVYKLYEANLN